MKKLNAEMWDKVQYIFRNYYDGMIHCAVVYEGIVDQAVMRKAIRRVVDKIDVLHSSFIAGAIKPYWVVNDNYTDEEMLYVHDGEVSHEAMERILTNRVDYRGKLQFKATLLRNEERQRSVLCLVINHICLDGRDFIALVKTIVEAYRGICADPDFDPVVKCGSRSAKQIYRDLPEELRKKAKMLYRNVSRTNIKNAFPFGEQCDDDKPHIVRATLSADKMSALKARGKADGYTVNDIYLAAYFTAAAKACGFKPDTPCEITSMLDMRRYLNDHETEGFTNLTSYAVQAGGRRRQFVQGDARTRRRGARAAQVQPAARHGRAAVDEIRAHVPVLHRDAARQAGVQQSAVHDEQHGRAQIGGLRPAGAQVARRVLYRHDQVQAVYPDRGDHFRRSGDLHRLRKVHA